MWTRRLLSLLQLTRMALVFTAVADGVCSALIWAKFHEGGWAGARPPINTTAIAAAAMTSIGLYGFGMSLNDIIDRRRDVQIAPNRPLPSGRIGVVTAHVVCALLALVALTGGWIYSHAQPNSDFGWMSRLLVIWTMILIVFYDLAGKYLVWPGILTLGLIRFFHAAIFAPLLPLLWHPLWLLNHVAILSGICYVLEEKRPALSKRDLFALVGGLITINACAIGIIYSRRMEWAENAFSAMAVERGILFPVATAVIFLLVAVKMYRSRLQRAPAGQALMLAGLLWLIIYDAAFAAGYVSYLDALAILALFPVAYGSVQLMRFWGKVLSLGQPPQFKRAGNEANTPE